jgi:hypothetical protein
MDLRRVTDIDFRSLVDRPFHPSPVAWEDEVLYFLLLDRFSDGRELDYRDNDGPSGQPGHHPLLGPDDPRQRPSPPKPTRRAGGPPARSGAAHVNGLRSKLGYLQRLGVSGGLDQPGLEAGPFEETYHGYATQNFLAVDPHFGTAEISRDCRKAHATWASACVLDVVFNHAATLFGYVDAGDLDRRPFEVQGFRGTKQAKPTIAFRGNRRHRRRRLACRASGARRVHLQGPIVNWDAYPEYADGDFFDLKDIHLGDGEPDHYQPIGPALQSAHPRLPVLDRLRRPRRAARGHRQAHGPRRRPLLRLVIHEFAQSIGKENFYLIAEITGDRQFAFETLEQVGMDAALGLAEIQDQLEWTVKGRRDPRSYFDLFRDSFELGKDSHTWLRNRVVTGYDDHDQVRKGEQKARFAADDLGQAMALRPSRSPSPRSGSRASTTDPSSASTAPAATTATCARRCSAASSARSAAGPARLRRGSPGLPEVARILEVRRRTPALRRGRQYLREISGDGVNFGQPSPIGGQLRSIVAWSRIFADHEVLAAINTDPLLPQTAWVTVDAGLQKTS